jgi:hypothetical protein
MIRLSPTHPALPPSQAEIRGLTDSHVPGLKIPFCMLPVLTLVLQDGIKPVRTVPIFLSPKNLESQVRAGMSGLWGLSMLSSS